MQANPDGSFSISDSVDIKGEGCSFFVFGAAWLLEILDLTGGEFFFLSNGEPIRPAGRRFGIYYPPFTIIKSCVKDMNGSVVGVGAAAEPPSGFPICPSIFETTFERELMNAGQAVEIIRAATGIQSIEFNSKPSLLSIRAKKIIDENYRIYPSIARIAARIGVSHEHTTRGFKRDYGMSPSAYLHQLRVAEATHKLTLGEEIVDISMDVGYNDLSRFYKQFRKNTGTSPGDCRVQLKR
jgi:AraC-like DNA-binding protein